MYHLPWGSPARSIVRGFHPACTAQTLFLLALQGRFLATEMFKAKSTFLYSCLNSFVVVVVVTGILYLFFLPPPKVIRSLTWVALSPCTPYPNPSKCLCRDRSCSKPCILCDLQASLASAPRTLPIVQIISILRCKLG